MASTPESKGPLTSEPDEKGHDVQREYLAQDETPDILEAKKKEDALRQKLDCYVAPVSPDITKREAYSQLHQGDDDVDAHKLSRSWKHWLCSDSGDDGRYQPERQRTERKS